MAAKRYNTTPTGCVSKRRRGRPPKDVHAPPYVVLDPDGPPEFKATMPLWWIAMADMEARLRGAGKWSDYGSPKELAGHFGRCGKSKGTVSEARADARYVALAERYRFLGSGQKLEPDPELRQALEDNYDALASRG